MGAMFGSRRAIGDRSLATLITDRFLSFGSSTAVASEDIACTFDEILGISLDLAVRIQEGRHAPDSVVAVKAERSLFSLVGQIACVLAGKTCLPIHPCENHEAEPFSELATACVLTSSSRCIDWPRKNPSKPKSTPVRQDLRGRIQEVAAKRGTNHVPSIYCTSGSTGARKLVRESETAILNEIFWTERYFGLLPGMRAMWGRSPMFAVSRWEIWSFLLAGCELHVLPSWAEGSPARLAGWMTRSRIEIGFVPPAMASSFGPEMWAKDTALRMLITGGDLLRDRPTVPASCRVFNSYGITEVSSVRTISEVERKAAGDLPMPVGHPIFNTEIHVSNDGCKLCEPDEIGEVYIGGTGLDQGYIGQEELQRQRFVETGFSKGRTVYRSGDLGMICSRGRGLIVVGRVGTTFLSRVDPNLGPVRLSIEQVEQAIVATGRVRNACVVCARRMNDQEEVLVAWLECGPDPVDIKELDKSVASALPEAFVPDHYMVCDRLPATDNGKLDRAAIAGWRIEELK